MSQPKCHQIKLFSWILDDGRAPATGIRRVNLEPADGNISPVKVRSALFKVAGYPGNFSRRVGECEGHWQGYPTQLAWGGTGELLRAPLLAIVALVTARPSRYGRPTWRADKKKESIGGRLTDKISVSTSPTLPTPRGRVGRRRPEHPGTRGDEEHICPQHPPPGAPLQSVGCTRQTPPATGQ